MKTRTQHETDQLRAGLMARMPGLFNGVKGHLEQIYDLIRKYAQRREYEVTEVGFNMIYSVACRYVEVKNGTFWGSSLIPSQDYFNDAFLTDILEQLTAIQRSATHEKDLELSRQVMRCFAGIAGKCMDIRYLANMPDEFPHSMLAVGYMAQNVEDALKVGLLDLGIQEAEILRAIGLKMIARGSTIAVGLITDHLYKVALYGISNKASFLVSPVLRTYAVFMRAWLGHSRGHGHLAFRRLLQKSAEVIQLYHTVHVHPSSVTMEMQFWLGELLDMTYRTAIPYIFDEASQKLAGSDIDLNGKKDLLANLNGFADELWRFFDQASKIGAEKESLLICFIDSNIAHISLALLGLYTLDFVGESEREALRKSVSWLLSVYWRLYDYHAQITANYHDEILGNLLRVGARLHQLGLSEEVSQVIGTIVSIAHSFLKKEKGGFGFEDRKSVV